MCVCTAEAWLLGKEPGRVEAGPVCAWSEPVFCFKPLDIRSVPSPTWPRWISYDADVAEYVCWACERKTELGRGQLGRWV